jgi:hypothetical protein
VDLLQSIVEIVTYGDRQDSQIFEYEILGHILFCIVFDFGDIQELLFLVSAGVLWNTRFWQSLFVY